MFNSRQFPVALFLLISFLFLSLSNASGQSYFFKNYNVEEGLVQSQVNAFCQDSTGVMWIATVGGLSKFDGTTFTNYTKDEGLPDNDVRTVVIDKSNRVWCGTSLGLSMFDGKKFTNYDFTNSPATDFISKIVVQSDGAIVCLVGVNSIYKLIKNKPVKILQLQNCLGLEALALDNEGNVWTAGYNCDVLYNKGGKWSSVGLNMFKSKRTHVFNIYNEGSRLWICSNEGLFFVNDEFKLTPYLPFNKLFKGDVYDIKNDLKGEYWIATAIGAFNISAKGIVHFTKLNQFISSKVGSLYIDFENDVWLGSSSGDGLFIYQHKPFTFINSTNGLPANSVRGLTKDNYGKIWISTYGGGLSYFNGGKIHASLTSEQATNISSCLSFNNKIWMGLDGGGLISYCNRKIKRCLPTPSIPFRYVFALYKDVKQNMWIGSNSGTALYANNHFKIIKECNQCCFSFLKIGEDSVLAGTVSGLFLLKQGANVFSSKNKILHQAVIYCLIRKGDEIWIGTDNDGILIWNIKTDELKSLTTENGMHSNMIYNLIKDYNDNVYAGTGHGIHQITGKSGKFKIKVYDKSDGLFGVESNLNASLLNSDSTLWFGTTKGIFILNPKEKDYVQAPPKLVLQHVLLFSRNISGEFSDKINPSNGIPLHPVLPHNKNSLNFIYKAICFSNPEKISYQYYMQGLEDNWSAPSTSVNAAYTSLPPGKYLFRLRAIRDGKQTGSIIEYDFVIKQPFYASVWFKIFAIVALVFCGYIIQIFRQKQKEKKLRTINSIKLAEQKSLQQKIAEDFHDEMGNKITRISLLSDVLKTKAANVNTDIEKIISQIKENAGELYNGTTDIIWSLNAESNSLYEIMQRVSIFGEELFEESSTAFSMENLNGDLDNYPLRPDAGRNLMMIIKEALNNALKYSEAKKVIISFTKLNPKKIKINISDNGVGFDTTTAKPGYGINNMKKRADRINAAFNIVSSPGAGTDIFIIL